MKLIDNKWWDQCECIVCHHEFEKDGGEKFVRIDTDTQAIDKTWVTINLCRNCFEQVKKLYESN